MPRTPETGTGALPSRCPLLFSAGTSGSQDPKCVWGGGGELVFLLPKLNPWVCRVSPLFLFCGNVLVYLTCPTFCPGRAPAIQTVLRTRVGPLTWAELHSLACKPPARQKGVMTGPLTN